MASRRYVGGSYWLAGYNVGCVSAMYSMGESYFDFLVGCLSQDTALELQTIEHMTVLGPQQRLEQKAHLQQAMDLLQAMEEEEAVVQSNMREMEQLGRERAYLLGLQYQRAELPSGSKQTIAVRGAKSSLWDCAVPAVECRAVEEQVHLFGEHIRNTSGFYNTEGVAPWDVLEVLVCIFLSCLSGKGRVFRFGVSPENHNPDSPFLFARSMSDDLLQDLLEEVAAEMQQVCDSYVEGLLNSEMASSSMSQSWESPADPSLGVEETREE